MQAQLDRSGIRRRVRYRIRKKITGTAERPRLAVFRSDKHIYVQAIDDAAGRTVAQASTLDKDVRGKVARGGNIEAAKAVGGVIADRLKAAGIDSIVFDRGGYVFHGRLRALADAARSAGLKF